MLPNRKVGCCLRYTSRLQSHYLIAFKQKLINSSREQAGQISEQAWRVLYKSSVSVQLRSSKWTRCTKLPTSLLHNSRQVGQFTSSAVSLHEHYFAPDSTTRQQCTGLPAQLWEANTWAARARRCHWSHAVLPSLTPAGGCLTSLPFPLCELVPISALFIYASQVTQLLSSPAAFSPLLQSGTLEAKNNGEVLIPEQVF